MVVPAAALVFALVSVQRPYRPPSSPTPIHDSIARIVSAVPLERAAGTKTANKPQPSRTAKIGAGVLGGVAGFFGGMFIGYAIDRTGGPCVCDDPGLKGIVIGAPVGAVTGALFGAWIVSR